MHFDIVTLFPGFFTGPFDYGILQRALRDRKLSVGLHDLRGSRTIATVQWTIDLSGVVRAWC